LFGSWHKAEEFGSAATSAPIQGYNRPAEAAGVIPFMNLARVGLTLDRWLVYMKLGGGWVHDSTSLTNLTTGAAASTSDTRGGFLIGGGIEYAFTSHWTARAEVSVLDPSDRTVSGPLGSTFTVERDVQMLKVGLNYKVLRVGLLVAESGALFAARRRKHTVRDKTALHSPSRRARQHACS
jgi:opacity protein-like surface antigen